MRNDKSTVLCEWFVTISYTERANVVMLMPVSYTHLDVYKRQM